jgi:methionyl-tRNA formyltransferase
MDFAATGPQRIVFFCATTSGVDTVAELVRRGVRPTAIVGLARDSADPDTVSGWIDVEDVGARLRVPACAVRSYALKHGDDRSAIEALRPDLIVVTGWQRLVPEWLIALPEFGVIGGHGSPDGIHGGRGRSPQTWALLLGCPTFDLSLFRIAPGVDDGPVLASRTFDYRRDDDIAVSYQRATLASADMLMELLADPTRLKGGTPQPEGGFYYPQRRPEDGWADWTLPAERIEAHCRALTRPYPGLRSATAHGGSIRIWRCQPFDCDTSLPPGTIGPCFESGDFLVHCTGGRLLVRDWTGPEGWTPEPGTNLQGRLWADQLRAIVERHESSYPDFPVSPRILSEIGRG